MTDKKTESSQEERARTQAPVLTTPASKRVPPEETKQASPGPARSVLAPAALVVALVALGLSGSLWMRSQQLAQSNDQLAARLASSQSETGQVGAQVGQALSRIQAQDARIQELQSELAEAGAVIRDLDEALRSMTDRGSELVLLNDIDHLATIAQQQLQLGGNVRNAIVALESAQAQLARANRPTLASLLQTVNGDLDRLRAASTVDIAAFSSQLEELAVLLTEAPLVMPDETGRMAPRASEGQANREQPAPTVPPALPADAPWWERALDTTRDWTRSTWDSVRTDLGQFIDVRRVDDAHALLMSPDQATRFRESLRTRVMTAQLALMMRQPQVWNAETQAIVKAIETRYDESSPLTRKALRMARSMADAVIDARLPTVDNTLHALNALREEQSLRFDQGQPDSGAPAQTDPQSTDVGEGSESAEPAQQAQGGGAATPAADASAQPSAPGATAAPESAAPEATAPEASASEAPEASAPEAPAPEAQEATGPEASAPSAPVPAAAESAEPAAANPPASAAKEG